MRKHEQIPQHQQMITQYLMSTLLPSISSYYLPQFDVNQGFIISPSILQNASSVFSVIRILHQVFPQESEYLLHLQEMSQQLVIAIKKQSQPQPQSQSQVQPQPQSQSQSPPQEMDFTKEEEREELVSSLQTIAISHDNVQLEEFGVTMYKRQGRNGSLV